MFEVGLVVKHDRAMVLRHRRGDQIDDPSRPVMPASGHSDLDVTGSLSNNLSHRQHDVQIAATLSDQPDVSQVPP